MSPEKRNCTEKVTGLSKQLTPVFQETDTELLKDLYIQPSQSKADDLKDINLKTGTRVADSILQKFNMIKNRPIKMSPKQEQVITKRDATEEGKVNEAKEEENRENSDTKSQSKQMEAKIRSPDELAKFSDSKAKVSEQSAKVERQRTESETRRKSSRKIVSREFIDDSESDSSCDSR